MRCKDCPAQIVEGGNESDPTTYYYCFYGEDYLDNHLRCFADGEDGCLKQLKTIKRDIDRDLDCKDFGLPKKYTEIDMNTYKGTLYDFLGYRSDNFSFDINDEFGQNCCWGLKSDINGILEKTLRKMRCEDVYRCFNFISEITGGNYYRLILKISVDELRKRK